LKSMFYNDLRNNLMLYVLYEVLGCVIALSTSLAAMLRCLQHIPPKTWRQRSLAAPLALRSQEPGI